MSEPLEIEYSPLTIRIADDDQFWYYHALVVTLLRLRQSEAPRVSVQGEGINIESAIGFVNITHGGDGSTLITIAPHEGTDDAWHLIASQIRRFAAEANTRRKQIGGMTADETIEHYYRSRSQGSRITLKQLAEQTGFSYSYLRTVKAAYDKAHGWGSKSKKMQGRAGTKSE